MQTNISFVKTKEQIEAMDSHMSANFFNQEKLQIHWTIPDDVYRRLLPPGLEPVSPTVIAYVSSFTRPQCHYPYTEGALFILGKNNGEVGVYCLAMPLDGNDQAQNGGREIYGYPKKSARVKLMRRGNYVEGWIERNDVRFFHVEAKIGDFNLPEEGRQIIGVNNGPVTFMDCVYLLDYKMSAFSPEGSTERPTGRDKFRDIVLVKQTNQVTIHKQEIATAEVFMEESEDDPWIELKPEKIIGAQYCYYETLMKGSVIRKSYKTPEEKDAVIPYLFARWDTTVFGAVHSSYKAGNFYR
jgi:hypothetical protein